MQNREIKFRAWKTKLGKPSMEYSRDSQIWVIRREPEEGVVMMQFTGLKDKNGKEIYDGDIYNEHGYRWIVAWDPRGGWAIKAEKGMNNEPFERNAFVQDNALKSGEVIGNIYENPELLHVQEASKA